MHYCFLTSGTWQGNASDCAPREFGNELIARGHHVSCIANDFPYNIENLPGFFKDKAAVHIVRPSNGPGQILRGGEFSKASSRIMCTFSIRL